MNGYENGLGTFFHFPVVPAGSSRLNKTWARSSSLSSFNGQDSFHGAWRPAESARHHPWREKSLSGEKAQANEYVSYALYYWPDPAGPEVPGKPADGFQLEELKQAEPRQDSIYTLQFPGCLILVRNAGATKTTGIKKRKPEPPSGKRRTASYRSAPIPEA